jgi:ABC-type transporter Mla subunit MlaD
MVKEYVEANNTRIEAVSIELAKEYKALQTIAKDNLKVSSILSSVVSKLDSFADVIRNYGSTYENLIDKIDHFSQDFGNLFSQISTVVDQINQPSQLLSNLYTSIQEMVNNQNLIVNSNKDFMDKTHERFENLLTKNGESNQVVIAELKEYLEKFIETVRETFSQQSMDELLSNHTIKLLDSITVLKASLDEINISSVTPEQINQINDLMSSLSISVNSISKVIGNLTEMTGRIDKINRNLGKVFESLGG